MPTGKDLMRTWVDAHHVAAVNATKGTTLLPEVMLAQSSVESGWGKSALSALHNNFFGIKKYPAFTGQTVTMRTREVDKRGNDYYVNAQFCKWPTVEAGFAGWVHFLQSNPRYKKVFQANTAEQQIIELKKAKYATDPEYVPILTQRLGYVNAWMPFFPLLSMAKIAYEKKNRGTTRRKNMANFGGFFNAIGNFIFGN
jgi:flagellum-specific peptidoglycan hydrolase FlgJ